MRGKQQARLSRSMEEEAEFVSEHLCVCITLSLDTLVVLPSWDLALLECPSKEHLLP